MTAPARAVAAVRGWPRALVLTLGGIAFVVVLGLPTLIIPLATDQVLFTMGAHTIVNGGQLYSDFWDIKPPLIYLLYAIPTAIAGVHMEAVRVLDLVNTGLAMAALYLLGRRFFGERAGVLAAAFYGFAYLAWSPWDALGEVESFMAAPLIGAFWLYGVDDARRDAPLRALGAGLLLGAVFALKPTAILFVLGLPVAELLLHNERWSMQGAAGRLSFALISFLLVQAALGGYLVATGSLSDFIDIQRHYTLHYNAYRYAPGGHSHTRFLVDATAGWVKDVAFLAGPAFAGGVFAFFSTEGGRARPVALLTALALLGAGSVWWQGKLFDYHWLVMLPLLAPLAGYGVDQLLTLLGALPRRRAWAAGAVLAAGLLLLALQPLLSVYDNYRNLIGYADGSLSRREVEAHYAPLYRQDHQIADYARANSGPDDRIFVWGFWPQVEFWLGRPTFDRFVFNSGLRATWSPQKWRDELLADLAAHPPRYVAVARGDNQPWLVGTSETSDAYLRDHFPELQSFIDAGYRPVLDVGVIVLYERRPATVRSEP